MPELPEVETMCRGIQPIVGARITAAERTPCAARPIRVEPRIDRLQRQVKGRRIIRITRLGKRVMVVLDSGWAIEFQPRMTGLVLIGDPPSTTHLRFRLRLSGAPVRELRFWDRRGLGSVRLVAPEQWHPEAGAEKLGVDALTISAEELWQILGNSTRPIKVALMDQRRVAGIGNLYASEILHRAKVHPVSACRDLSRAAWRRVHHCTQVVLQEAIRHEGSTLADGTYRNALNNPGGFQMQHRVYGRAGKKCVQCGRGTIQRIVQGQRSTFFCPRCQRTARSTRS